MSKRPREDAPPSSSSSRGGGPSSSSSAAAQRQRREHQERRAEQLREELRIKTHTRTCVPKPEALDTLHSVFNPQLHPEYHLGLLVHIQDAHAAFRQEGEQVHQALSMGADFEAQLDRCVRDAFADLHARGALTGDGRAYWLLLVLTYMLCHAPARQRLAPPDAAFLLEVFAVHLGQWLLGRRPRDGAPYGHQPGQEPDTAQAHTVVFVENMRALYAHRCRPLLCEH